MPSRWNGQECRAVTTWTAKTRRQPTGQIRGRIGQRTQIGTETLTAGIKDGIEAESATMLDTEIAAGVGIGDVIAQMKMGRMVIGGEEAAVQDVTAAGRNDGTVAVVAAATGTTGGGTVGAAVGVRAGIEQKDPDTMIDGEAERDMTAETARSGQRTPT